MGFNENFAEWLQGEMALRNWSQGDLARESRVARQTISEILNLKRTPGAAVSKSIALALKLPVTFVFIKAGLINEAESSLLLDEIKYKVGLLPAEKQQMILDLVDSLLTKKK